MKTEMSFDEMIKCYFIADMALGCENCVKFCWGENYTEDPTKFHDEKCPLQGRQDVLAAAPFEGE